MRLSFGMTAVLWGVLVAIPVDATELVRVLLVERAPRVTVTSPQGVTVRLSQANERVVTGPLRIAAGPSGLLVNGVRVQGI